MIANLLSFCKKNCVRAALCMLAQIAKSGLFCLLLAPFLAGAFDARLALELVADSDWEGASLEFRRLALEASDVQAKSGFYWAAAFAAWHAKQPSIAGLLLDRAEDIESGGAPVLLLRAAIAESLACPKEAAFYYQGIIQSETSQEAVSLAARRLASLSVAHGNATDAARALAEDPLPLQKNLEAMRRYEMGRDKSPLLGGILGLVPGLGYAYSGEYANALRSAILNAIFAAGMFAAADQDAWGVFAVIAFFEATWYSGSIYGGVDAAHRHNRNRQTECIEVLRGADAFTPDWRALPVLYLRFSF